MDEEDYSKLTVENACVHKVWKARLIGYEGAAKHFQQIEDEKSPEWNKFIGLVKNFVVDSHVLCQEKGLEAVLVFVENCGSAGQTTRDVVSGIIQKCLAAPKARTRELAANVILMYIEIEKHEIVFDELIKGTEIKNPKVVAACIHVIAQALKEFGCNIINVSKLIKHVPSLLDDRDVNVRSEAKLLVGVVYHWLGPVIKPKLAAILKTSHLIEVETEYEKEKDIPAKATRFLRSKQNNKSVIPATDGIEAEVREKQNEECEDDNEEGYDLLEPVDILSKLDKNFYTKLESTKWSERKEALEEFQKQLAATPKLEPTDYNEIVRALKKVISKDSNVAVVGIAIKCVTGIASGLKKKFNPYVSLILSALYEKFKEKKQTIVAALREAVDAVYLTTNLEAIQEDVVTYLENKNPYVKSEICRFLSRCFSKSTANMLTKKLLKIICKVLTNCLRDQDPAVRDNSALALGTAMKVVGEKIIGPFLGEIDPQMLKKIKECCNNVHLSVKQTVRNINDGPKTIFDGNKVEKINYGKSNKTSEKQNIEEKIETQKFQGHLHVYREKDSDNKLENDILSKINHNLDKAKVDISNQITGQLVTELGDRNWQIRLNAIAKLQGHVNSSQSIICNLGDAAPLIAARISDSNTKISASAIALVQSLAPAMGPSFKQYVRIFLPALIKSLGDTKAWIRSAIIPCFNIWGEVCGFKEFFEGEIIAEALKTGSTSVKSELWAWMASLLPNIPNGRIKKEELTACLPTLYSNLEDKNFEVRKHACDAVLGFMLHLGYTNMIRACENIKGSGSIQVKQILEKTRGSLPVQPIGQMKTIGGYNNITSPSAAKSTSESSAAMTNLYSRGDTSFLKASTNSMKKENIERHLLQVNSLKTQRIIDEQKLKTLHWNFVTPTPEFFVLLQEQMTVAKVNKTLVAHMFHNDFRYHIRAIDALTSDLQLNKEALISNLDLILRWMSLRFFDTNPSVLIKGLDYLNSVFRVLREEEYIMMDSEASAFFPYLLLKIGNPKDNIRNSVRAILKQMSAVYPVSKQFFYVMGGLKSKNARQRSESLDQLSWLIENYGISVCNPSPAGAMKEIAKYIADRDTSVRNAALNCVMTAYFLEGEKTLKLVGPLSEKNKTILEDKIKKSMKRPPMNIVKPLVVPAVDDLKDHQEIAGMSTSSDAQNLTDSSRNYNTQNSLISNIGSQETTRDSAINGACGFDKTIVNEIKCTTAQFRPPKLVDIDLRFLKDQNEQSPIKSIIMAKVPIKHSQPAAIIHELLNIDNNDIERAMAAISRIETILNSEKWHSLTEFVDLMVSQLVYLMKILDQSEHTDILGCYRANFSLFTKLCNHPEICSKITDVTLNKIFEQLLHLLNELRSDMLDKQDLFVSWVNSLLIRLLENSNKTNVLCALLNILKSTVTNPEAIENYNDFVVKWVQKLTKFQSEWDYQLDYSRILDQLHSFLKDYPTSWWKTKELKFPLRAIKIVLHSMVKIRGTEVREIFKRIPNVSKDSGLYKYIKRTIKQVKLEGHSKEIATSKENKPRILSNPISGISKRATNELSEIFGMIGDFEEMSQGIIRLFEFKNSHPEADIQTFLSKASPQFQQFIMQGLQALEHKYESSNSTKNGHQDRESLQVKEKENFTEEAEVVWNRLKCLQEKLGYRDDKNKENVRGRLREIPKIVVGINTK